MLPTVGRYGVSVLAEHQESLSNHFAGRTVEGLDLRFLERHGVPLVEGAVAHFVVQVADAHPAGDHTLYVGRVVHFEAREDRPLLFYSGRYQKLRAEGRKHEAWPQDEFSLFSIGGIDPPVPR
jgi:flavin reductase (DIM6/NTAB) family NADH-FMN oxidoreductase RutF